MSQLRFRCETDSLCGMVGRPSYIVSYEQLLFLIENGFSVPQIADMIGVSVRTVSKIHLKRDLKFLRPSRTSP